MNPRALGCPLSDLKRLSRFDLDPYLPGFYSLAPMVSPWTIRWFVLLACWLAVRAAEADEAVPAGPQKGVLLLLRNGEVISGTIAPAGDRFDVRVGDGEV